MTTKVPKDSISFTKGDPRTHVSVHTGGARSGSGEGELTRRFCGNCGESRFRVPGEGFAGPTYEYVANAFDQAPPFSSLPNAPRFVTTPGSLCVSRQSRTER
jgi:hypothetical protein